MAALVVPDDLPMGTINRSWTDEQRRIVWTLISKARGPLQIPISPIVASAFIILQRYFRTSDESAYELFPLMVATLFTAGKAADSFRPIQFVYAQLVKICQSAPSQRVRSLIGDRDASANWPLIAPEELVKITSAELDLLRSIDFDFDMGTPFLHFEKWKQTLLQTFPDESFIRVCNSIIVDICLMICSAAYLDVPPEAAAAAATAECVPAELIPPDTLEWMRSVQEKYGPEVFELARQSIAEERRKTLSRGPIPMGAS
jgi:hypothetical protein